jgi:hypothetical protein
MGLRYNFPQTRDKEEKTVADQVPASKVSVELKKSPVYSVVPANEGESYSYSQADDVPEEYRTEHLLQARSMRSQNKSDTFPCLNIDMSDYKFNREEANAR